MNKTTNIVNVNEIMYPIYIITKTLLLIKYKLGITKIYLIVKGSKSKSIVDLNTCKTFGLLKNYSEEQIKTVINILLLNNYLKEKTITSGFGSVIETTSKIITWISSLNNKIDKDISFDAIYDILIEDENKLTLNIPYELNKIVNTIKIKKSNSDILEEFNDLL